MENFTIHIFGYGETQINSKDLSVKVKTDTLITVMPLVDGIFAKKPADNPTVITNSYTINIFNYNDIRWVDNTGFNVKDDVNLKPLIDALIAELQVKKDEQPVVTPK